MIFHEFNLGDVEDPEIYAATPLCDWQNSEQGRWIMQHCRDPKYKVSVDPYNYGYKVIVYGDLTPEAATYFTLKYK
jgi:hypothetical protein